MQLKPHKEELLFAFQRAVSALEAANEQTKSENEEMLQSSDLSEDERFFRTKYSFDDMHNETMGFVREMHSYVMRAKTLDELKELMHMRVKSLLPGYGLQQGDFNEYLHFQKFVNAFYAEYANMLHERPDSTLDVNDPKRQEETDFQLEQEHVGTALLDVARHAAAGSSALAYSFEFAKNFNPFGQSDEETSFGFIGFEQLKKEYPDLFKNGDEVTLDKDQALKLRNNAVNFCVDIVHNYLPENCDPKEGQMEIFYLIGRSQEFAAQLLMGEAYDPDNSEEYMKSEEVVDVARQLLEPIFRNYYPSMFENFDTYSKALVLLDQRMKQTVELGYVPIEPNPDLVDMDEEELAADTGKRPLMDVKDLSDAKLPLAVGFVINKMERIYKKRIEKAEAQKAAGATPDNTKYFIDPEEIDLQRECVTNTLINLRQKLLESHSRQKQEAVLYEHLQGLFEAVIYDGLPINSYSDLRLALDFTEKRLAFGLYRDDVHPWSDLFADLDEYGEMCDEAIDDICIKHQTNLLRQGIKPFKEDGTPNPDWRDTPYGLSLHKFFDGAYDGHDLSDREIDIIQQGTHEMVQEMFQEYSDAMPTKCKPHLMWFVGRATEHFAQMETPLAKRVMQYTPRRLSRGDLEVHNGEHQETAPERATVAEARRKAMHIIREEDPSLVSEAAVTKAKTKKRKDKPADTLESYTNDEVRGKVNRLLGEILSADDCVDAANNVQHALRAKTRLEARLRNTSLPPEGPGNPAIDQSR